MWRRLLDALPRGYTLDEHEWQRRHRLLLWVLGLHVPCIAALALALDKPPLTVAAVLVVPSAAVGLGYLLRSYRRTASIIVTFGLVYCSAALVAFTDGRIEAHFHFFIIIGFIALYQDWAPFLLNIVFTVISHGIGSVWQRDLIFDHAAAQANPWLWSLIHGVAVLFACVGMMLFWRVTEESQEEKDRLSHQLSEAEIGRRQFTSDLLTNLARRNQSLLYRQLDIINQLEESERDPDALAELFRLDHIATRVRRNAENLLVLSGEQPPRTWSDPVPLRDVLRAAIAETEDLSRVVIVVDEQTAVVGHAVTDLTHLMAELTENAVRFSPPDTTVTVRSRPDPRGGRWLAAHRGGLGHRHDPRGGSQPPTSLLADAPELDMSVSQRLGFHVVARLAARHGIQVSLSATPGSGVTALVRIPAALTTNLSDHESKPITAPVPVVAGRSRQPVPRPRPLAGRRCRNLVHSRGPSPRPSCCRTPRRRQSRRCDPSRRRCRSGLPPTLRGLPEEASPWDDAGWDGWWAPPAPQTDEAVGPTTLPRHGAERAAPDGLRRRVPQTHLVGAAARGLRPRRAEPQNGRHRPPGRRRRADPLPGARAPRAVTVTDESHRGQAGLDAVRVHP